MNKIKLIYRFNDTVAQIILNDGKGNILDSIMMDDLQMSFKEISQKTNIKLITFEGEGKHFSFGASVEEHQKEMAATMLSNFHQLFYVLKELSIPTAAIVSGQCLGGGLELALMCNFIFADQSAKFAQPELIIGVFPPPASILLPEKIGLAKAEEWILTGKSYSANDAKSSGLVNEVFDTREELFSGVSDWIEKNILPKSATSLRFGVKAVRAKMNHVLGNFLPQLENLYVNKLMETSDANEGIAAFLEKRTPNWERQN